jgi:hypothetical protein
VIDFTVDVLALAPQRWLARFCDDCCIHLATLRAKPEFNRIGAA